MSYTKLFGCILDSSIWNENDKTVRVWVTMLASANKFGEIEASVGGLAKRARVDREDCESALHTFLSPDPDSRTSDHDGRRIEEIDGGWRLLNWEKYMEKDSLEERRRKDRERQARRRKRQKQGETGDDGDKDHVTSRDCHAMSRNVTNTCTSTSTSSISTDRGSGGKIGRKPKNLAQCKAKAMQIGMDPADAEDWYNDMEACEWTDRFGDPVGNWVKMMTSKRDFIRQDRSGSGKDIRGTAREKLQSKLEELEKRLGNHPGRGSQATDEQYAEWKSLRDELKPEIDQLRKRLAA